MTKLPEKQILKVIVKWKTLKADDLNNKHSD